jgi:hypothetical protein
MWIQDIQTLKAENLVALAEAAWLLDDPRAFRLSTRQLIFNIDCEELASLSKTSTELSDFTITQISSNARSAMISLMTKLHKPFYDLTRSAQSHAYPTQEHGSEQQYRHRVHYSAGKHDLMVACSYTMFLNRISLGFALEKYPSPLHLQLKLSNSLSGLAMSEIELLLRRSSGASPSSGCKACSLDVKAHIRSTLASLSSHIHGLCLDCMRNENKDCDGDLTQCRRSS